MPRPIGCEVGTFKNWNRLKLSSEAAKQLVQRRWTELLRFEKNAFPKVLHKIDVKEIRKDKSFRDATSYQSWFSFLEENAKDARKEAPENENQRNAKTAALILQGMQLQQQGNELWIHGDEVQIVAMHDGRIAYHERGYYNDEDIVKTLHIPRPALWSSPRWKSPSVHRDPRNPGQLTMEEFSEGSHALMETFVVKAMPSKVCEIQLANKKISTSYDIIGEMLDYLGYIFRSETQLIASWPPVTSYIGRPVKHVRTRLPRLLLPDNMDEINEAHSIVQLTRKP